VAATATTAANGIYKTDAAATGVSGGYQVGEVPVVVGVVAEASRRHQLVDSQSPRSVGRDVGGIPSVFLEQKRGPLKSR
jgi:hypothetical protein